MKNTLLALCLALLPFGIVSEAFAQPKKKVIIQNADRGGVFKRDGQQIRKFIGNVAIKHEDVTIHCDSLYDYIDLNKIDAFGNVKVFQQTSTLFGDTLFFDGSTKQGRVRGRVVKLLDDEATLVARYIDFSTQHNTANYYGGGVITTKDAKFSSVTGKYFSNQKFFAFSGHVAYSDSSMLVNTDSLEYFTQNELLKFFGPTRIYNKNNYLFCEKGWHSRTLNQSEFQYNSYFNNGDYTLFGNNIYYDRALGEAKVNGSGCVVDIKQRTSIYGDIIEYNEITGSAKATNDPFAVFVSDQSDSLYLRADAFFVESVKDKEVKDSTLYNILTGDGGVRFYRNDIQGVCDSMVFHGGDSILHLHVDPILWNGENQLKANEVKIRFKDDLIHRMIFTGSSFVVSQEDSSRFNQIKGRDMEGFFSLGKLFRLNVMGNGETVYFIRDKGEVIAVNRAESSSLSIGIKENAVTSILFKDKPIATLYPIEKAELSEVMLKGFVWQNSLRPASRLAVLPPSFNPKHFVSIESKAALYRNYKHLPADSINHIELGTQFTRKYPLPLDLDTKKPAKFLPAGSK